MSDEAKKKTILLVDDSPENIDVLDSILKPHYRIKVALNGEDALKIANKHPQPDLILLDIVMPGMDGFEVCRQLKADAQTRGIQVIFVTATTDQETVARGLELGAYYYLTKPVDPVTIEAVVKSAISEALAYRNLQEEVKQTENALSNMESGLFELQTFDEAKRLAMVLAKVCPESDKRIIGLTELLFNAIEHGNLEISYDEKGELIQQGQWPTEVERRLRLPQYADKKVAVTFEKRANQIRFIIRDQGAGFEWQRYLQLEASRATHSHGRGIALANMMSFDELQYQGSGNEVIAIIRLPGKAAP
jgi:CheY-like chemotaxis protein